MIADIDITKKPFNLTAGQAEKVEERLSAMSTEEKVGQVFCPIVNDFEEDRLSTFARKYMPGGIMYRPGPSKEIRKAIGALQEASPIPLLTAANLESGGNGIGLSLVKFLVKLFEGKISVESEVGKGTRFIVRFPEIS